MCPGIKDGLFAFGFRASANTLEGSSVILQAPGLGGVDDASVLVLNDGEEKRLVVPKDLRVEAVAIGPGGDGLFAICSVVLEGVLLWEKGTKRRGLDRQFRVVVFDA